MFEYVLLQKPFWKKEVKTMSNAMIAAASLYHDPRFFDQSEIRIRNNKILRQRELRRHLFMFAIILFSISFILVFWRMGLMSDAHTEDQVISYKYYCCFRENYWCNFTSFLYAIYPCKASIRPDAMKNKNHINLYVMLNSFWELNTMLNKNILWRSQIKLIK